MNPNNQNLQQVETEVSVAERMHPVIRVLRRSLQPEDQAMLDELYGMAEENISLAKHTVGLVTELEMILFSLLIEQQKLIYLIHSDWNRKKSVK